MLSAKVPLQEIENRLQNVDVNDENQVGTTKLPFTELVRKLVPSLKSSLCSHHQTGATFDLALKCLCQLQITEWNNNNSFEITALTSRVQMVLKHRKQRDQRQRASWISFLKSTLTWRKVFGSRFQIDFENSREPANLASQFFQANQVVQTSMITVMKSDTLS